MQPAESAWVPIAEAARQFGVSIDTVRRRIKRGELTSERRATPQGFVWWVYLGGSAEVGSTFVYADPEVGTESPTQATQVGAVPPRRQSEAPHLAALVRELQAEVLQRTEAATTWQVRAEILSHQLAAAEDRIKALEAPKPEPAPPLDTQPPTPNAVPRWRRWPPLALAALLVAALLAPGWAW